MLEVLGFVSAIVIGLTLGLIGSGGSILTVPALVYLLGVAPVPATAYSLFVVGLTSLIGSLTYMKKELVSYKTAIVFSIPSFLAVFLTRKYIMPGIPDEISVISGIAFSKDIFVMIFFAILMIMASVSMIRKNKPEVKGKEPTYNYPLIMVEGFVIGILTGLVGAGGGFLIIPALVLLAKLPMKIAVGTSLLIIAIKSLIGFLGDIGGQQVIEWSLLMEFSLFTVAGIFLGTYLSKFVSGGKLKPVFGWFVMIMGIYIIVKEIL